MPAPWPRRGRRPVADCRVFHVQADRAVHPVTGVEREFFVLDGPDWVNVVALRRERAVVLVEQYRHGTREVTLEIPGGAVEPGEDPLEAGLRELREETGHAGRGLLIGCCLPNPALQSNRCFTVLVDDAVRVGEPEPDEGEDLSVLLRPLDELPALLASGRIDHALVITALHHLRVHLGA